MEPTKNRVFANTMQKPYKSEYCHETGIRILAGFVALTLAKYSKSIEVKLSHSTEHYMRLYIEVKKGSKK